jgi:hypothetical protein
LGNGNLSGIYTKRGDLDALQIGQQSEPSEDDCKVLAWLSEKTMKAGSFHSCSSNAVATFQIQRLRRLAHEVLS